MADNDFTTISVEVEGDRATLTLDRPDVFNAFNDDLSRELRTALDDLAERAEEREVRCLVITGAGDKAFCSGQDVKDLGEKWEDPDYTPEFRNRLKERYNPVIERLAEFPAPTLAAINGVAAGAGLSLALACDFRIAVETATFTEVFVNVGLVPDSGSSYFLPRIVGLSKAMELCATGRQVDSEEAEEIDLVNETVDADEFEERIDEFAAELAGMPTTALVYIRRLLHASYSNDLPGQLEMESYYQDLAGHTEDHREGVTAFLNKREPDFTGE